MKSLLDLLRDESFLITKYNRHIENAEIWSSEKMHCNPDSEFEIEYKDYQRYADLEKESRDEALKYSIEIAKVRQEILEYIIKMNEDVKPKKKPWFTKIFKK